MSSVIDFATGKRREMITWKTKVIIKLFILGIQLFTFMVLYALPAAAALFFVLCSLFAGAWLAVHYVVAAWSMWQYFGVAILNSNDVDASRSN